MTVRRLSADDRPELWPMLQAFGTDQTEESTRLLYSELLADPRWAIFGYAERGGRLVGYTAVQDYGPHLREGRRHQGRLHDLNVSPDQRRTGVGRTLLTAAVDWAGDHVRWLEWQAHHERRRSTSASVARASRTRSRTIQPSRSSSRPDERSPRRLIRCRT